MLGTLPVNLDELSKITEPHNPADWVVNSGVYCPYINGYCNVWVDAHD